MAFPRVDVIVIFKEGYCHRVARAFFILLASGVGPGMGIELKPDNEAWFLTLGRSYASLETRNLSCFRRALCCPLREPITRARSSLFLSAFLGAVTCRDKDYF